MPQYQAIATIGANTKPLTDAFSKATSRIESRRIQPSLNLGKFTTDFTKFEQSLDAATARVVAFTATTSLLYGVGNAFKRLTQDAIQIESVMARIQSIFGSTTSETKQFQSAIFKLANDVGLSFFQVAEAAEEFSRQGLTLNKTLEATRAAAVVAKLSGSELKGVIEGLTATLSTFNDGTLDYIKVANKLVALDSAFATSAAGITEGLKRVSGVAVEAGLSFDQTAAAITSLKQVTGRSEAVIGNSLKSIFTSLQTEKVQKDLATLGVETKDASGEFRNLVDVLGDLSKVYETLGDAQKTVIAQRIGKTYQANAFQGILRTFQTGDYQKALQTSQTAGSSAEDRLEQLNKTTQSALQRFSNNITQLGGNLGDKLGKPLLDTVVGYMNKAIDAGNAIFGGSGLGDALIGGLKNVLEGPGIVLLTFSLAKLLKRITIESAQAIKSISGISGAKENILKIDQFITSSLNEQNRIELERIKSLTSVAAQQKAILDLMNRQVAAQEKIRLQGSLGRDYGITALQTLNPIAAGRAARRVPNRGRGELPEVNKAIIREAIDIRNGVGGARSVATPLVKTLNLGKGPQKVVVNSDEKVVPNFAGSGQHAVLNRQMMGLSRGSVPSLAKSNVYLYDGERGDHGEASVSRSKNFKKAGFNLVDLNNIEKIAAENVRRGIKPILLDPTLRVLDDLPASVRRGFSVVSATNVPLDKFQEASLGGLSKSISLPSNFNPRSRGAINSIIETGRKEFGGDNFFIKGRIGAQSDAVFTPGSLYYRGADRKSGLRKTVPKALQNSGGIFLQEGLRNIKKGSEFRVNAIKIGGSVETFGKTALKSGGEAFGSNERAKGLLLNIKKKGLSNAISELLGKKIAETQVKNSLKKLKGYSGAIAGADVAETGTSGILNRTLQLIGEKTGLNIGTRGGGVIEYNFSQLGSSLYQGGNSGALRREDVIIGAGKALQKISKVNVKDFVKRGKQVQKLSGAEQNSTFKTLYKDLLAFKKFDEVGYLKAVKGLGKAGFGVTAGRGASKKFISYKSLAEGFLPIAKALNKEAREIKGYAGNIIPQTAFVGGKLSVVNSAESVVGDSVVPNYASGHKRGRKQKLPLPPPSSAKPFNPASFNQVNASEPKVSRFNGGSIMGGGFGISFIGGAIAEGYKTSEGESTQASRGIGGLSQSVGIGAQLAIFGKAAGAVGLVAGAVAGLNDVFGENVDNLNGVSKSHEDLITRYKNEGNAIESYQRNFEALSDAIANGSEEAAKEARKNLTQALGSVLDPGLRGELSSASSIEDVSRASGRIAEQRSREISGSAAFASVAKLRQEKRQGFLGGLSGRDYAPEGSYENISDQIINSIDFSKFSSEDIKRIGTEGFNASDLDETNKKTLKIFSERFKGEEIILKAIENRVLAEKDATKSVENLDKTIQKAQDFTNIISGSAQKASFAIAEKSIKASLSSSLADISLQESKPFTSDISFAEAQLELGKTRRAQDYSSKIGGFNNSLIEKAQELTVGRNLSFDQLGKIQGAFSKFGETQDSAALLEDFKSVLGTDSKELVKFAQSQFLEIKKLNAETEAANQEASASQRVVIDELKRSQRGALFGGGVSKFDKSQVSPGLLDILRGPKYNKFSDPARPGRGVDARTGRRNFSDAEFAKEEANALDANEGRYDNIIKRAQYLKESGYFGVEPTENTPQALKDVRKRLLDQEVGPLGEAFAGKQKLFAKNLALSQSGDFVGAINKDAKRITGSIAITDEQKKVIANAIKTGSYDTAIGALDKSTSQLGRNYGFSGKGAELDKIDKFRTFLQQQKENTSLIGLSSSEKAREFLKVETEVKILTDIKGEQIKANSNLSLIAKLMQGEEASMSVQEGLSKYNIAAGEVESLKVKRQDNREKFDALIPRLKKELPFINTNSGVRNIRNEVLDSVASAEKYDMSQSVINERKSLFAELKNIRPDSEYIDEIKQKQAVSDSLKEAVDKLKESFDKVSDKLKPSPEGSGSKIDQNINVNATVSTTNSQVPAEFKADLQKYISNYMKENWGSNSGGKKWVETPLLT